MSTLFVARWAKAYSPDGAALHVVGVIFVGLSIGSEFQANVSVIIHVFAGKKITRGQGIGYPIGVWKSVEPKNTVPNEATDDNAGNVLERKCIVPTTCSIFDGADVPLDARHVFVLGADVETHVRE